MDNHEVAYWMAIDSGLITYTEANDMYLDEIIRVIQAKQVLNEMKSESIEEVISEISES